MGKKGITEWGLTKPQPSAGRTHGSAHFFIFISGPNRTTSGRFLKEPTPLHSNSSAAAFWLEELRN
jgi:hypothetical protein